LEVGQQAAKKRVAAIFKNFDEIINDDGYDLSELPMLKSDL